MIEDADAANAYLHFVHALCEMACNQKRISVQEREVENEKYAWLHRRRVQSGAEDFA